MLENTKNGKKVFITLLLLSLIGFSLLNTISLALAQSANYELKVTKGTTLFSVQTYDDDAWNSTISNSQDPSHWFGGAANNTGAQSKITIEGWTYSELDSYDVLLSIFPNLILLNDAGYNETTINGAFPTTYWIWNTLKANWRYTIEEFNEKPDYSDLFLTLKDPEKYKQILDDYNMLATQIQNDINVSIPIRAMFPNITGDDLLWQLVPNKFAAAAPIENYLLAVTDALETENTTANGCSLIFYRTGLDDYSVEFAYDNRGTLTSVIIKDQADNTIYYITSENSEWIFYTILTVVVISSVGIIIFLAFRSRKIKRT